LELVIGNCLFDKNSLRSVSRIKGAWRRFWITASHNNFIYTKIIKKQKHPYLTSYRVTGCTSGAVIHYRSRCEHLSSIQARQLLSKFQ